ncbi:subclass B1 metallo-beta-lactamase [Hyphococcus flavus]|uniref:beta-lactamase n=1 Tax=Hyphococcus flavus TaxID=1866326 RepID=A0AAF0CGN2_9PROT|nr:subclass B1 metallo-beta-lactamase [Hyphococcus flavus]WDI32624.1 subclass B1 metallo-beta-lactamase [Hyphococcus flavus]
MMRLLLTLPFVLLAACASAPEPEQQAELPALSLEKIADGVWVHKSYKDIHPWGPILSNGLVIDMGENVALVDTAWTNEDTSTLLDEIEKTTGVLPDIAIITHAHEDKMGGVGALQQRRIGGRAHPLTNEDAPGRGLKQTLFTILDGVDRQTLFGVSEENIERDGPITVFYPGPGHTRDNIVVYYAPSKVLFGGCLIRPGGATNLGNTADGDIGHWAEAVRKVAEAFPDAEIVIPSHGAPGRRELLDHTIALAEAAANAQ